MLTAEARIATERPTRYLVQLCKHFDNRGRHLTHRPRTHTPPDAPDIRPEEIQVEWTDSDGTLRLPWGRCTLRATPGMLRVHVEAEDQESLGRLQDLVTTHIGRFSRRDPLTVDWNPSEATVDQPGEATPARRRHGGRAKFVAIGVTTVAVALHLALGGTVLAQMSWTGWVVGFLATAVVVKVALLGRLALHHHGRRTG
ncbi:DUF2218 domain-containing protein [Streptomyces hokutonensis]|uniref:DUF2218 domain-containing protein n=1 Tax=Streptomyces hokutonensis TaxID=1306990 RepID=UPI0033E0E790